MERKKQKISNFFKHCEKTMSKESIERSNKKAQKILLQIRLKELREKEGFKQTDINSFSQPSISRIESRHDLKLSTLQEYLTAIGMTLEIIARPKKNPKKKYILLK